MKSLILIFLLVLPVSSIAGQVYVDVGIGLAADISHKTSNDSVYQKVGNYTHIGKEPPSGMFSIGYKHLNYNVYYLRIQNMLSMTSKRDEGFNILMFTRRFTF